MSETTPDLGIVGEAIRNGNYDDHLDALIKAAEERKFHIEPWDVLSVLADCAQRIRCLPIDASSHSKAELGAEINARLKHLRADIDLRDDPYLLNLWKRVRVDVLVRLIGIPRENLSPDDLPS